MAEVKKKDIHERSAIRALNERLAIANNFDAEALFLNKQGMLATSQKRIIHKRIAYIVVALLFFGYITFVKYQDDGFSFIIAILLVVLFFLARAIFISLRNASQKKIESMEGIGYAILDKGVGDDSDSRYYEINGNRFYIKSEIARRALIDGLHYRVYYTPKSRELVNIEALEAPPS